MKPTIWVRMKALHSIDIEATILAMARSSAVELSAGMLRVRMRFDTVLPLQWPVMVVLGALALLGWAGVAWFICRQLRMHSASSQASEHRFRALFDNSP